MVKPSPNTKIFENWREKNSARKKCSFFGEKKNWRETIYPPENPIFRTYYRIIQNAFTDTEQLLELLGEKPEPLEPEKPEIIENIPLSLSLENVSFKFWLKIASNFLCEIFDQFRLVLS